MRSLTNRYTISTALFVLLVIGVVLVAWSRSDRFEGEVYLAVAQAIGPPAEATDGAFLSRPTNCNATEAHAEGLPADMWSAFLEANQAGAQPVRLSALEGRYNVVSWKDTVAVSETQGEALRFLPTDKRLVHLSRVGFDAARSRAILCIETHQNPASAWLWYLEKRDGIWELVEDRLVWLS